MNRITLNIPHSSVDGLEAADWEPKEELVKAVNMLTDWHTNIMFYPDGKLFSKDEIRPFVFHKNRFVVDAERLIDDPMEKIGQGIIYTNFYERIHRSVSEEEKATLYREREEYLAGIEQNILTNDSEGYNNILIDCHSFPAWRGDVDICIGFNEDFSKPSESIINGVIGIFKDAGYSVGMNTPYSNSLQPIHDPSALQNGYFSFMIELSKRIYLNEADRSLSPDAPKAMEILSEVYKYILTSEG